MTMSWKIDNAHTQITFSARHMMLMTVRGRFEKFTGEIEFDPANPAATSAEIEIDAASLTTNEAQRDGHLKSPDFLQVADYPTITFRSQRVEVLDPHHAHLIGDLTIRDQTHPVKLEVEYLGQAKSPWGTTSAGFSAQARINRKDWGLTWNVALETGGWLVGEEVTIHIELEIVKLVEPEAELALA
jgi:polyisoprenoid-binding protein YceI